MAESGENGRKALSLSRLLSIFISFICTALPLYYKDIASKRTPLYSQLLRL